MFEKVFFKGSWFDEARREFLRDCVLVVACGTGFGQLVGSCRGGLFHGFVAVVIVQEPSECGDWIQETPNLVQVVHLCQFSRNSRVPEAPECRKKLQALRFRKPVAATRIHGNVYDASVGFEAEDFAHQTTSLRID